jgi:hypothetical protein
MNWRFIILFIILVLSFIFLSSVIINKVFIGEYLVNSYWIGNDSNGVRYCDNCLWIKFDEGCNRYKTFYFKNQHELDNRLKVGMPVSISFRKDETIFHIEPKKAYLYCSRNEIYWWSK